MYKYVHLRGRTDGRGREAQTEPRIGSTNDRFLVLITRTTCPGIVGGNPVELWCSFVSLNLREYGRYVLYVHKRPWNISESGREVMRSQGPYPSSSSPLSRIHLPIVFQGAPPPPLGLKGKRLGFSPHEAKKKKKKK